MPGFPSTLSALSASCPILFSSWKSQKKCKSWWNKWSWSCLIGQLLFIRLEEKVAPHLKQQGICLARLIWCKTMKKDIILSHQVFCRTHTQSSWISGRDLPPGFSPLWVRSPGEAISRKEIYPACWACKSFVTFFAQFRNTWTLQRRFHTNYELYCVSTYSISVK